MCVCACMCMHVCVYIHVYVCACMNVCMCVCMYVYACVYIYMHACLCACDLEIERERERVKEREIILLKKRGFLGEGGGYPSIFVCIDLFLKQVHLFAFAGCLQKIGFLRCCLSKAVIAGPPIRKFGLQHIDCSFLVLVCGD